ncbi:MAG TPA: PKD domain-containing protein, partial [Bacillales bacterium]|nr:PKD domain-containing protein [Bacillales bacterium]
VNYEAMPPVITSPKEDVITNEGTITIEGTAAPTTKVTLIDNGEQVASTDTAAEGTFSADIALTDGENVITAVASKESGTTGPSAPVTVTLDRERPDLTIDSPADGWKTNDTSVTVTGTMTDDHADWVKVNGEKADLNADGSYSHRMLLNDGKNVITVVAADKAGNKETKQITVYAKFDAPKITNLEPAQDVYLNTGETVKVEMDSEPGLDATFTVHKPLTNPMTMMTRSAIDLPMVETGEGHYVGYWTVPSDWTAEGAQVQVTVKDEYGNQTDKLAKGLLYINVPNDKPEARFDAPGKTREGRDVTFDASASMDLDGSIEKYEWRFGDGQTAEGETVVHRYSKKGKYKVTLTVTDNRGATDRTTRTIRVLKRRGHKH